MKHNLFIFTIFAISTIFAVKAAEEVNRQSSILLRSTHTKSLYFCDDPKDGEHLNPQLIYPYFHYAQECIIPCPNSNTVIPLIIPLATQPKTKLHVTENGLIRAGDIIEVRKNNRDISLFRIRGCALFNDCVLAAQYKYTKPLIIGTSFDNYPVTYNYSEQILFIDNTTLSRLAVFCNTFNQPYPKDIIKGLSNRQYRVSKAQHALNLSNDSDVFDAITAGESIIVKTAQSPYPPLIRLYIGTFPRTIFININEGEIQSGDRLVVSNENNNPNEYVITNVSHGLTKVLARLQNYEEETLIIG